MSLNIDHCCDIEDLIDEIVNISKKDYNIVEKILFKYHLYPESRKTFICFGREGMIVNDITEADQWLENSLKSIFADSGIDSLNITEAI